MAMIKYTSKDCSTICPVEGPAKVDEILMFQEAHGGKVRVHNPRTGKSWTGRLVGTPYMLWDGARLKQLHLVLEGSKAAQKEMEIHSTEE